VVTRVMIFTARQQGAVLATINSSVRPSVCLSVSVTRWYCIKMTQTSIMLFNSLENSPMTLVSSW